MKNKSHQSLPLARAKFCVGKVGGYLGRITTMLYK